MSFLQSMFPCNARLKFFSLVEKSKDAVWRECLARKCFTLEITSFFFCRLQHPGPAMGSSSAWAQEGPEFESRRDVAGLSSSRPTCRPWGEGETVEPVTSGEVVRLTYGNGDLGAEGRSSRPKLIFFCPGGKMDPQHQVSPSDISVSLLSDGLEVCVL